MHTRAHIVVVALSVLAAGLLIAPRAHAGQVYGPACSGASSWTSDQCDNSINDDGSGQPGNYSGQCYGACGPACSYNCGGGGACTTHDYYTRHDGMWSGNAMSAFPAAAAQWGRCVMSAGSSYASGALKSSWSGIKKGASSVVNRIFN